MEEDKIYLQFFQFMEALSKFFIKNPDCFELVLEEYDLVNNKTIQ